MKNSLYIFFLLLGLGFGAGVQNVTIVPTGITPLQGGGGLSYPRISFDAISALPSPTKGDMVFTVRSWLWFRNRFANCCKINNSILKKNW
jgi:hypothetical protein